MRKAVQEVAAASYVSESDIIRQAVLDHVMRKQDARGTWPAIDLDALSGNAIKLALILKRDCEREPFGIGKEVADKVGCSRSTLRKLRNELVEVGLLVPVSPGGNGASSFALYRWAGDGDLPIELPDTGTIEGLAEPLYRHAKDAGYSDRVIKQVARELIGRQGPLNENSLPLWTLKLRMAAS